MSHREWVIRADLKQQVSAGPSVLETVNLRESGERSKPLRTAAAQSDFAEQVGTETDGDCQSGRMLCQLGLEIGKSASTPRQPGGVVSPGAQHSSEVLSVRLLAEVKGQEDRVRLRRGGHSGLSVAIEWLRRVSDRARIGENSPVCGAGSGGPIGDTESYDAAGQSGATGQKAPAAELWTTVRPRHRRSLPALIFFVAPLEGSP